MTIKVSLKKSPKRNLHPYQATDPFGMALVWDHSKYFSINVQPKLTYVDGQLMKRCNALWGNFTLVGLLYHYG